MAEEVPVSEFKARCLALFDRVAESRAEYIVTRHGRPVARVVPLEEPPALEGSVRVLVDDDSWFSIDDLVVLPGESAEATGP